MYKLFPILFTIFFIQYSTAQDNYIVVEDIVIKGNFRTKERAIHREINLTVGDTILLNKMQSIFDHNRLRLLGTGLFNSVIVNLSNYKIGEKRANLTIEVEENWYLFPAPIFELADRNFNVWWQEQGRSLDRVNYGARLTHFNFTGNRDPLKLKVHFGYTTKYELTYQYPFLALDNKLGIGGSIFYSENREIAYRTIGNKTLFASNEDDRKLLSRLRVGPEFKYRPNPYVSHGLRLEYHQNKIDDFVAEELNPDYFLNGRTELRFFFIEYDYSLDKRIYNQYPLGGFLLFANIKKEGLGLFGDYNNLSVTIGAEKHWAIIENKLILSTRNKAKTNLIRGPIAYANNTGLGWDPDIVSGYELFVLDGTDFLITINSLKYRVFDNNVNTAKWLSLIHI